MIIGVALCCLAGTISAKDNPTIRIETENMSLVYRVGDNGRLYQIYLGKRLAFEKDLKYLSQAGEAYLTHGMEDYYEPALHIGHNDGNPSTLLNYVSYEQKDVELGSVEETVITLADEQYPVTVQLHYLAYKDVDVICTYTEISHEEKNPVSLEKYASSLLYFDRSEYFLTEFSGDWAHEANMQENKLTFGKKVVDSKLGARANMFVSPFFQIAFDEPAHEDRGEMLMGTLGWTGNFRFTFEMDHLNHLRVISGINPYASDLSLPRKTVFRTPDFYFTYSLNGRGEASRNFHNWARKYQLKEGNGTRMTLLNNWESTYFDFDEEKLVKLIGEAKDLGVDMFLLDDGWFGEKYPRSGDYQGLGDWIETSHKLPNGIGRLTEEAKKQGIKFGLWIEPEMVNPKSELYEKHKDWVIHLPNRDEYYFRNQLVLDLSNPDVQDHVFGVVDKLMTAYPDIAFFKWDCNSPITNIYSSYLEDNQSHLYVDYVRGLYNVLDRIQAKYPDLPMMLCAGGGGRSDYEALKYFTEFWPSDNTDPIERLFIQWGYSQVFPVKSICAHVTSWNGRAGIKFRTDVAMMCKLGFDLNVSDLSINDMAFCKQAVQEYNRLKPIVLDGDLYRLVSPYNGEHAASMYVDKLKQRAVLFSFDIHPRFGEHYVPVRLKGLDINKMYHVKEINMMPGDNSSLQENDRIYSGEYLMNIGVKIFTGNDLNSRILEIQQQ